MKGKNMKTSVIEQYSEEYDLSAEHWEDPASLDSILLENGMFRSDAGTTPKSYIIVGEFDRDIPEDEMRGQLSEMTAALAAQRAILAICSCDRERQTRQMMGDCCGLVPTIGKLHADMLSAEIERTISEGMHPHPATQAINYEEGLLERILIETMELLRENTTEQLAVANDMAHGSKLYGDVPISMNFTTSLSRSGMAESPNRIPWVRNVLGWMKSNPEASDARLFEYLRIYGKTTEDLEGALNY